MLNFIYRKKSFQLCLTSFVFAGLSTLSSTTLANPRIADEIYKEIQVPGVLQIHNILVETSDLAPLYQSRSYSPLWISNNRVNEYARSLKNVLNSAYQHGLEVRDYWLPEFDQLMQAQDLDSLVSLELLLTDSYIRYAKHLHIGRVVPNELDPEVLYTPREFDKWDYLNRIMSQKPNSLKPALDKLAPQHPQYAQLVKLLSELRKVEAQGGWHRINSDKVVRLNNNHPVVTELRLRLSQQGYLTYSQNPVFDSELNEAVKQFQLDHQLEDDGIVGRKTYCVLYIPVSIRIHL